MRAWGAANKERVNEERRVKYAADAERRVKITARVRAYQASLSEDAKRERAARRRDRVNETARAYYKKKRDQVLATNHAYRARVQGAAGADYTTSAHISSRWQMWGGMCRFCGEPATCTDHRIPLARGGSHFPANLVPACTSCNNRKHDKTEREFLVVLA